MNPLKTDAPSRVLILAALVLAVGCNQNVSSTEDLPPRTATQSDPGAGSWRMLVLSGPTQIAVPPPSAVTSDAYKAELAAIKDAQSQLTDAQRETIQYWSGGGVLRWNQILRELVARYNLPPAPRDNGTYVFPDAENPFADPQFPFSNPPYATRAYSYVSVGQFEALKSAWAYKYQYNRPSPSKVDSGIQALMSTGDLPAYPSEDAVMSGVSADLLKLLFPAAVEEITKKAGDQRNAALWSGKASASDIAAGLALGKAVAVVFTARAATDGMRNAVGNKAQWDAFAAKAVANGEIPWTSLDTPARPPMLPFFGQVKGWNMTPTDITAERPAPPPSTSSAQMKQELAEVKSYSDGATREQIAIANKWSDGAGTYTPPGHWNDIAAEPIRDAGYSEVRAARAFALLNMALQDAAVGCWEAKYYYFNPRPTSLDPSATTAIGLPNFPAYTSGHSTFSGAAAEVLSYLFPSRAAEFGAMRDEASISRLYGSIHYRSDIEVGKDHGKRIAGYTIRFARQDGAD
jgi:PAP2 superfamily protein